jgi:dihydroorotate dehydrogenase
MRLCVAFAWPQCPVVLADGRAGCQLAPVLKETGGLSGRPLKELSLNALTTLYRSTEARVPLIGCGGISSGQDAIDFAKAGATFVQLYTGLVYRGVGLPRQIKDEVTEYLKSENKHWVDLVGSGVPKSELALPKRPAEAEQPGWDESLVSAKRELQDLIGKLSQFEQDSAAAAEAGTAELSSPPPADEPAAASIPAPADKDSLVPEAETGKVGGATEDGLGSGGEEEKSGSVLGPLGGLFSSFGERSRASESPKRVV